MTAKQGLRHAAPRRSYSHHYAHRVKESLTGQVENFICSVILSLLLIASLIVFILWLSLRPHRPWFYPNSFTVNQPDSTIAFNVSDHNLNHDIVIYYGEMNGSVYYFDQVIASGPVMAGFVQPPKNTALIQGQLGSAASGSVRSQITANQSTGRLQLRLQLKSTIRFRVKTWDTHSHKVHVGCEFAVGSAGNLLPEYVNEKCPIYF